ncbi:MAG: hypothetical protein AAGH15_05605 [Myxococcota bacterium]
MTHIAKKLVLATVLAGVASGGGLAGRSYAQGRLMTGGQNAFFGTHFLGGGFSPDPRQFANIEAGGNLAIGNMGLGPNCTGYASGQPHLIINYSNPGSFLRFYFQGQGDAALVINDGSGNWRCNDDFSGTDPQVDIQNPVPGQYDIWVSSYQAGQRVRGNLMVTELPRFGLQPSQAGGARPPTPNRGGGSGLAIGGNQANFGVHNLQGGFTPDPYTIPNVVSGGNLNVASMGLGGECRGFATRQPDLILNYRNARNFLRFYVQGQGDTALVINDANGNWHCNDDTAGLNPQVDLRNPPSGQYDIWVSSYTSGENIRGTVFVTELMNRSVQP